MQPCWVSAASTKTVQGGWAMDLPRVRRDVRGAPRDDGTPATAYPPLAMGVIAVEAHELARLFRLSYLSSARESARLPVSRSDDTRTLSAMRDTTRTMPCRCCPEAFTPPEVQNPGGKTVCREDTVVRNRTHPVHNCGARAPWRKSKQRLTSARCTDCRLRLLFPRGSRYLPVPFSNARVEVGRTVMEG